MSLLAVVSDLHVDRDAAPESFDVAQAAFEAAVAAGADHVLVAGDLFDSSHAQRRDRASLRRMLRDLGLWKRHRLSVIPGNHDVFGLGHHNGMSQWLLTAGRGDRAYREFSAWAGDLFSDSDRLASDDLFPFAKDLGDVLLLGADTTAVTSFSSGSGYWREEDDELLRTALGRRRRRRELVLAVHHPPFPEDEQTLARALAGDFSFGFVPDDFERLHAFVGDVEIDRVVCGHLHAGADAWSWRLGPAQAHIVGRSGGLHGEDPRIGLLDVTAKGTRWRTQRF